MKKICFRSLGSLVGLLGILAVIGLGSSVLTGCTKEDGAPPVDEKALKAQYQAEAEKNVNEKNADTVAKDLEKEIESDTATE